MTRPQTEFGFEIPGYEILREVGRGGVSTVYLARHELLERQVAIKVMSPVLAIEDGFSRRFIREGQTVAQLEHPGIVTVYDVAVVGHRPFIAMEFLSGGSLKDRMDEPLPPKQAISMLRTIADSLGYAHSRGVFHRDVKPENILFRENGDAVLTDFGIAKSESQDTALTSIGVVVGTPRYISPEQAQGNGSDGRSDIYALGVIFHEMLTGHPPYDTKGSMSLLYAHINEPIPRLSEELAGYQDLLDDLLAKDPDQRVSDCSLLVQRLDRSVFAPLPVHVPHARRTSGRRSRQDRLGRTTWSVVLLAGLAISATVLVLLLEGYNFGVGSRLDAGQDFTSMVASLLETGDAPPAAGLSAPPSPHRGETEAQSSSAAPARDEAADTAEGNDAGPERDQQIAEDPEESPADDTAPTVDENVAIDGLDAQSIYDQAQALLSGGVGESNPVAAARLHKEAADRGHPLSQYYLGVAYGNGDGVERDEGRALQWLTRAAEAGVQGAKYNLILARFFGSNPDARAAAKTALELGEQQYPPVYSVLGWMYNTGTGVDSNFGQSVRWSVKTMVGDITGNSGAPRWVVRRWERQLEVELSKLEADAQPAVR